MVRCAPWAVPHAREGELVQAHPGDCSPCWGPCFCYDLETCFPVRAKEK